MPKPKYSELMKQRNASRKEADLAWSEIETLEAQAQIAADRIRKLREQQDNSNEINRELKERYDRMKDQYLEASREAGAYDDHRRELMDFVRSKFYYLKTTVDLVNDAFDMINRKHGM